MYFIEGPKNYVAIYTNNQKIVSLQRLKVLEEQLAADKFIRVHNSYIVAKKAVASIKDNEVYIANMKIPVGKTYTKPFMYFVNGYHLK